MNRPSKRCMIVCASGAGSAMLLQDRLRATFGSKLEILGTVDYYKLNQMSLHALDFVIFRTESEGHPLLKTDFPAKRQALFSYKSKRFRHLRQALVLFSLNLPLPVLCCLPKMTESLRLIREKSLSFCGKVCLQERMSFAFCAEK